jgi:hypothetical protein
MQVGQPIIDTDIVCRLRFAMGRPARRGRRHRAARLLVDADPVASQEAARLVRDVLRHAAGPEATRSIRLLETAADLAGVRDRSSPVPRRRCAKRERNRAILPQPFRIAMFVIEQGERR